MSSLSDFAGENENDDRKERLCFDHAEGPDCSDRDLACVICEGVGFDD